MEKENDRRGGAPVTAPTPTSADVIEGMREALTADQVEWVVNDIAELGVKIGNQFFFLYKGASLVYEDAKHDDGRPMRWRHVYKREFGECCHPIDMTTVNAAERAGVVIRNITEFVPSDSEEWADLPLPDSKPDNQGGA